jgi:hypothetical protein
MPKVGRAMQQLAKGDYREFKKVMDAIPAHRRGEVVMTALNDSLTAGSRAEKQLSIPGFVDWYENLKRNGAAMRMLNEYLPPGASKRLETLYKVTSGMRRAGREKIGTGLIQGLLDNFAQSTTSKLFDIGKKAAAAEGVTSSVSLPGVGTTGVVANVLSKASDEPLTQAADRLLASPEFLRMTQEYAKAGASANAAARKAEDAAMRSKAFSEWAKFLSPEEAARIAQVGLLTWISGSE